MFHKSYAYTRFQIFCERFNDNFTSQINKVLSQADSAFFDLENEVLDMDDALPSDADAHLSRETHRIKRETLTALQDLINGFFDDVQPVPKVVKKPAKHRLIPRDVACRYLQIYGGKTQRIPTAIDDMKVVLIDADGDERGQVSSFDGYNLAAKYHEAITSVDRIPF